MKSTSSIINEYKHPKLFYILSTLIPWMLWFLAAYISHISVSNEYLDIASIFAFIGLLVPVFISYLLIAKKINLKKDVINRLFNFKNVKPFYILLTCSIMPVSIMTAQAISLILGYSPSQFIITGEFTFSSGIFPVWFLLILAPVSEELAWHTYGTDALRKRFNLFNTSLLFGIYWGIWHFPLSFIRDYYQSNVVETGWIYGVNFLVSIIPYVLLMNWLYYKTNRNIIVTIIFHITAGFFNELFVPHPDSKIIQTILLIILAVFIIIKDKDMFFKQSLFN